MTKLTIRQKNSLYNQQAIKFAIKQSTSARFKIKQKGKHCFYVTFETEIPSFSINKIAKRLGLEISYQSNVRCIISDEYDASLC